MKKELDNFDPLAELESNMNDLNNKEMDPAERKSVWKMNYHMKNKMNKENEKLKVINEDILPNVK